MEIDWVVVGWIVDIALNGIVWLVIAAFLILLIDVTDKWTRKAVMFMGVADIWARKVIESSFEWIQKKNLNILFAIKSLPLISFSASWITKLFGISLGKV